MERYREIERKDMEKILHTSPFSKLLCLLKYTVTFFRRNKELTLISKEISNLLININKYLMMLNFFSPKSPSTVFKNNKE